MHLRHHNLFDYFIPSRNIPADGKSLPWSSEASCVSMDWIWVSMSSMDRLKRSASVASASFFFFSAVAEFKSVHWDSNSSAAKGKVRHDVIDGKLRAHAATDKARKDAYFSPWCRLCDNDPLWRVSCLRSSRQRLDLHLPLTRFQMSEWIFVKNVENSIDQSQNKQRLSINYPFHQTIVQCLR